MATQKEDIAFGKRNEDEKLNMLEDFLETTLQHQGSYAVLDFMNPTKSVFVELKSRRVSSDRYDTALIGLNKIKLMSETSDIEYHIVYKYLDGVFTIKYNKEQFDKYEVRYDYKRGNRSDCKNKADTIVLIPITDLTKLEYEQEVEEEFKTESLGLHYKQIGANGQEQHFLSYLELISPIIKVVNSLVEDIKVLKAEIKELKNL